MATVKTVNGLALASVKTFNGISAASLKTINGLDSVVASGGTLLYDAMTGASTSSGNVCGHSPNYYYTGAIVNDSTSRSITKVALKITAVGSITGKTWTVRLWNVSGTTLSGGALGTSNGVTGVDSWSATEVEFTFSSPVSVGNNYAITLDPNGVSGDTSNRVTLHYANTAESSSPFPTTTEGFEIWVDNGSPNEGQGTTKRLVSKIYAQ